MAHPSFIVLKSKNDKLHFNLTAKNGQVILTSQQYGDKAACMKGIDSVKRNAPDQANFEKHTTDSGKFYFNLKAANAQIIGTSQMYTTESARDNGIKSTAENAALAGVEEQL